MSVVISCLCALFVYSCFQYGKIFYPITERVVRYEAKRLGVVFKIDAGSFSQRSDMFDAFIDFIAPNSFILRLFNCSLCFTTWVVLALALPTTFEQIVAVLGVNYLLNFVHNRI